MGIGSHGVVRKPCLELYRHDGIDGTSYLGSEMGKDRFSARKHKMR